MGAAVFRRAHAVSRLPFSPRCEAGQRGHRGTAPRQNYGVRAAFAHPTSPVNCQFSTIVLMRLGTSPTGTAFTSFIAGTSITDTERMPALET